MGLDVIQRNESVRSYGLLTLLFIFSLGFNLWGNRWGAPNVWHPDSLTERAIQMVEKRTLNPHFFAYGGLQHYIIAVGAVIPIRVYEKVFDPHPGDYDQDKAVSWY